MKKLGLLGKNIGYSFSKNYFTQKFKREGSSGKFSYENFDIESINILPQLLQNNPELIGLNVTIPYKEEVITFLEKLSEEAKKIGAVNTIKFESNGKLTGHNTDYIGFLNSLKPLLQSHHKRALILGTGGASKAIIYALEQLGIEFQLVSRISSKNSISYQDINETTFQECQIIINCTPLGTFPTIENCPGIPYEYFTSQHIAYDLIYNPEKTSFLAQAEKQGAVIKNGYEMLVLQAEYAWTIWNSK